MFYYFGGKKRLSALYPEPEYDTIIEPFAGGAAYACRHGKDRRVILIEKDERVVELWRRLLSMSSSDILSLPTPAVGSRTDDLLVKLACCSNATAKSGPLLVSGRMGQKYGGMLNTIASLVDQCRHFEIIHGSYEDAPNIEATWHIDPPYQHVLRGYLYRPLDFSSLGEWCLQRRGQVMVCEQRGADWMPFQPLANWRGGGMTEKMEVMWTNRQVDF